MDFCPTRHRRTPIPLEELCRDDSGRKLPIPHRRKIKMDIISDCPPFPRRGTEFASLPRRHLCTSVDDLEMRRNRCRSRRSSTTTSTMSSNARNKFCRALSSIEFVVLSLGEDSSRLILDSRSSTEKNSKRRKKKQQISSNSSMPWSNGRWRPPRWMNISRPACSPCRIRSSFRIHCKNGVHWQNRWVKHCSSTKNSRDHLRSSLKYSRILLPSTFHPE